MGFLGLVNNLICHCGNLIKFKSENLATIASSELAITDKLIIADKKPTSDSHKARLIILS
jgi:hypothetical protein